MQPRIENGLGAVHLSRPITSTGSATNVTRSRTTDPGEARAWLASRYTDHELYHRSRSSGFDFVHIFAPIKEGSANFLRYGGEVEIQPGPFPDFYMLEMPVSGGVRLSLEGEDDCESSATHALFLPPNRALGSLWRPGTMQFMLKLKASEVVRRWQALVQDPGASLPAVPPQIEFQNTEGWRVQQSMLLLKAEFERGLKQGRSTLHVSPLSAAVIDSVLAYIRACHGARAEPERRTAMPAALHKCLMYFAAHYRDDIRMTDLVALTGQRAQPVQSVHGISQHHPDAAARTEAARGRPRAIAERRPLGRGCRVPGRVSPYGAVFEALLRNLRRKALGDDAPATGRRG